MAPGFAWSRGSRRSSDPVPLFLVYVTGSGKTRLLEQNLVLSYS